MLINIDDQDRFVDIWFDHSAPETLTPEMEAVIALYHQQKYKVVIFVLDPTIWKATLPSC